MNDLEKELFEANKQNFDENVKLTQQQQKEVEKIVEERMGGLVQLAASNQARIDMLAAAQDPSKPNYKEMCELGAQVLDSNPNLQALRDSVVRSGNRLDYLYEVGVREDAYQKQLQAQEQAKQPIPQPAAQPQHPNSMQHMNTPVPPHHAVSPQAMALDPSRVDWRNLTDKQFMEYAALMGHSL